jgi:hypothetical protein
MAVNMPPLFSSFVESCLQRATLEPAERELFVEQLAFGRDDTWQSLRQASLPGILLPSTDPILLALRRWIARDPRPLGARHRVAMQQAERRPLGFLRLALEEATLVALRQAATIEEHPRRPEVHDVLALADGTLAATYPKEFADLEALGLIAIAACQLRRDMLNPRRGSDAWQIPWDEAIARAEQGKGDAEIQVTALEVAALGALLELSPNRWALANGWWHFALGILAEAGNAEPDRIAEVHTGYAAFLHDAGQPHKARKQLRAAERLMKQVDPLWNEPLCQRLASAVR